MHIDVGGSGSYIHYGILNRHIDDAHQRDKFFSSEVGAYKTVVLLVLTDQRRCDRFCIDMQELVLDSLCVVPQRRDL